MSVLIKDMGMPQDCVDCPCVHDEYAYCKLTMNRIGANKPNWCPLIELPQHGRLIDADVMTGNIFVQDENLRDAIVEWIYEQKTVIEAEDGER